jgi:hypothetical protein
VLTDQVDTAGGADDVDLTVAAEDFGELLSDGIECSSHGGECRRGYGARSSSDQGAEEVILAESGAGLNLVDTRRSKKGYTA